MQLTQPGSYLALPLLTLILAVAVVWGIGIRMITECALNHIHTYIHTYIRRYRVIKMIALAQPNLKACMQTFLSSGKSAEILRFTKRRDLPSSAILGRMRNGCAGDVTMRSNVC